MCNRMLIAMAAADCGSKITAHKDRHVHCTVPPEVKVLLNVSRKGSTLYITNPLVVPQAKQPEVILS